MPIAATTTETAQLIEVQAADYAKGRVDNTIRKRLLPRLLDSKKRITYNNRNHQYVWVEQFDQPDIQTTGAGGQFSFGASDLYRQCGLGVRGYSGQDSLYYKDHAMNGASGGMIQYYGDKIPRLLDALEDHFAEELYLDGNDTARPDAIHGFNSLLGYTAPAAGDLVAQPNDSYAGHSTALGTIAGTWSSDLATADQPNTSLGTDWPDGSGDVAYDWHSPLIVNGSSTRWGTTTNFYDNAGIILRRATTWGRKNGGKAGRPTCYMMGANRWNDYTTYQEQYFRNIIPHTEGTDLGFPETLNQEGVMVSEEFNTPPNEVFILNINRMELKSVDGVLWRTVGPHYDMKSDAFLFRVGFFGNLIMSAKYQGKIVF